MAPALLPQCCRRQGEQYPRGAGCRCTRCVALWDRTDRATRTPAPAWARQPGAHQPAIAHLPRTTIDQGLPGSDQPRRPGREPRVAVRQRRAPLPDRPALSPVYPVHLVVHVPGLDPEPPMPVTVAGQQSRSAVTAAGRAPRALAGNCRLRRTRAAASSPAACRLAVDRSA
jgi:hypothetical protein